MAPKYDINLFIVPFTTISLREFNLYGLISLLLLACITSDEVMIQNN